MPHFGLGNSIGCARVVNSSPSGTFTYLRPGGVNHYFRPDGISSYRRP